MITIIDIIEVIITILCVLGLLWEGIWIGRNFGTFENFVLKVLEHMKNKMGW